MEREFCTRCKKRKAVIFTTAMQGDEEYLMALCLHCAKELGLKDEVDEYMKQEEVSPKWEIRINTVEKLKIGKAKMRKPEEIKPPETKKAQTTIFISYSWDDSEIVDIIEPLLEERNIKTVRDVRDITYKQSIKAFMAKIKDTDFSIILISDSYLKSFNCMYEILEFIKDENYKERILPVVVKSTDSIFSNASIIKYINFWEEKFDEERKLLSGVKAQHYSMFTNDLNKIADVSKNIGEFLRVVKDMTYILVETNESTDKLRCAVDEIVNYIRKSETEKTCIS